MIVRKDHISKVLFTCRNNRYLKENCNLCIEFAWNNPNLRSMRNSMMNAYLVDNF